MKERKYEGWIGVYRTGKGYEAELVRDRLDDAGIPAVNMSKRDSAFNLNVGSMSDVFVMVPPESLDEAREVLAGDAISSADLEAMALAANPDVAGPDVSDPEDSGDEAAGRV